MEENKKANKSVEEVLNGQKKICLYSLILNLIFAIISLILKFDFSIFLGIVLGGIVIVIFHWWMIYDLQIALTLDSNQAINYANKRMIFRRMILIIVLVLFVANKWIKVNPIGILVGVVTLKAMIYITNFKELKSNK